MVSVCLRTYLLPLNDSALFTRNLAKVKKKKVLVTSLTKEMHRKTNQDEVLFYLQSSH